MATKAPKKKPKMKAKEEESYFESDNDFVFDEVTGGRDKKPVMSVLNKKRITRWEMDELFLGEE